MAPTTRKNVRSQEKYGLRRKDKPLKQQMKSKTSQNQSVTSKSSPKTESTSKRVITRLTDQTKSKSAILKNKSDRKIGDKTSHNGESNLRSKSTVLGRRTASLNASALLHCILDNSVSKVKNVHVKSGSKKDERKVVNIFEEQLVLPKKREASLNASAFMAIASTASTSKPVVVKNFDLPPKRKTRDNVSKMGISKSATCDIVDKKGQEKQEKIMVADTKNQKNRVVTRNRSVSIQSDEVKYQLRNSPNKDTKVKESPKKMSTVQSEKPPLDNAKTVQTKPLEKDTDSVQTFSSIASVDAETKERINKKKGKKKKLRKDKNRDLESCHGSNSKKKKKGNESNKTGETGKSKKEKKKQKRHQYKRLTTNHANVVDHPILGLQQPTTAVLNPHQYPTLPTATVQPTLCFNPSGVVSTVFGLTTNSISSNSVSGYGPLMKATTIQPYSSIPFLQHRMPFVGDDLLHHHHHAPPPPAHFASQIPRASVEPPTSLGSQMLAAHHTSPPSLLAPPIFQQPLAGAGVHWRPSPPFPFSSSMFTPSSSVVSSSTVQPPTTSLYPMIRPPPWVVDPLMFHQSNVLRPNLAAPMMSAVGATGLSSGLVGPTGLGSGGLFLFAPNLSQGGGLMSPPVLDAGDVVSSKASGNVPSSLIGIQQPIRPNEIPILAPPTITTSCSTSSPFTSLLSPSSSIRPPPSVVLDGIHTSSKTTKTSHLLSQLPSISVGGTPSHILPFLPIPVSSADLSTSNVNPPFSSSSKRCSTSKVGSSFPSYPVDSIIHQNTTSLPQTPNIVTEFSSLLSSLPTSLAPPSSLLHGHVSNNVPTLLPTGAGGLATISAIATTSTIHGGRPSPILPTSPVNSKLLSSHFRGGIGSSKGCGGLGKVKASSNRKNNAVSRAFSVSSPNVSKHGTLSSKVGSSITVLPVLNRDNTAMIRNKSSQSSVVTSMRGSSGGSSQGGGGVGGHPGMTPALSQINSAASRSFIAPLLSSSLANIQTQNSSLMVNNDNTYDAEMTILNVSTHRTDIKSTPPPPTLNPVISRSSTHSSPGGRSSNNSCRHSTSASSLLLPTKSPVVVPPTSLPHSRSLSSLTLVKNGGTIGGGASSVISAKETSSVLSPPSTSRPSLSLNRRSIPPPPPTTTSFPLSTTNKTSSTANGGEEKGSSQSPTRCLSDQWSWIGEGEEKEVFLNSDDPPVKRKCYACVRHTEGDEIKPRFCVLLASGSNRKKDLPYIAKISALFEQPDTGEKMMTLMWYYRPEHIKLSKSKSSTTDASSKQASQSQQDQQDCNDDDSPLMISSEGEEDEDEEMVANRNMSMHDEESNSSTGSSSILSKIECQSDEIFASTHLDVVSLACIEDKCYVLTLSEYCRYRKFVKLLDQNADIMSEDSSGQGESSKSKAAGGGRVRSSTSIVPSLSELPERSLNLLPNCRVAQDRVFLCQKVYDVKKGRILKNPKI